MCLGIPMKILKIDGERAIADLSGVKKEISIQLMESVKLGDYVIVHAGFAIEKLSESEAQETLKLLKELTEFNANLELKIKD